MAYYDDDEVHDFGFELPDMRHHFICIDGDEVKVIVVRHWFVNDEDESSEPNFKVSFDIIKGKSVTSLPIGTNESRAIDVAHQLYDEDFEATTAIKEVDAMYEAERRAGA